MKKITWKKGVFSTVYKLYYNEEEVGFFKQSSFGSSSKGKFKETNLSFNKKGFFKTEIEVIDLDNNKAIGTISFKDWGSKAQIKLEENNYQWQYDNPWNTKWSISANEKKLISYHSTSTSGKINTAINDERLLLCDFCIYNYYLMLVVIISAVSTSVVLSS